MGFIYDNIFNIIGVASFIIGILAFLDGRSSKKEAKKDKDLNNYIYETAFRNMNMDITSEQIKELNQYKAELQDTIENKLPQIALQNNIKNKIAFHKEQIVKNYNEYEKLCEKIESTKDIKLPDNIMKIISDKLMPEEARRREQEKNIILLFIIFIIYIIISNIPYINRLSILFLIPIYKPATILMEAHFINVKNVKGKVSYIFNIIISFYTFTYSYTMMDSYLSIWYSMQGEVAVVDSSVFFIWLFVCFFSFVWFMASMLLLLKDIITKGNTRRLKKKVKICALCIIYIFLLLLFCIGIYYITNIATLSSSRTLEIHGQYSEVKMLVLLILESFSTMIIVPILNIKKLVNKTIIL